MSPPDRHLDGNAVAGVLAGVLVAEPTTAERICQSCRSRHPIGAHRAYAGAGMVLRCPTCSDVAFRLADLPGRQVVEFRGQWIFWAEAGSRL